MHIASEVIFFGSYLVFPIVLLGIYGLFKVKFPRSIFLYVIIFSSILFIYARFIERNFITVSHESIQYFHEPGNIVIPGKQPLRIAVVGDIHAGVYKGQGFVQRVVDKVNQQNVDIVFLVGDYVFMAKEDKLESLLRPLQGLSADVYGVLGNHDYGEYDEEDFSEELTALLSSFGVQMIDNKTVDINFKDQKIHIMGIGDLDGKNVDINLLKQLRDKENNILVTHNPDVVSLANYGSVKLAISGHTHCGQVRIPGYKMAIPTKGEFFNGGLTTFNGGDLFITCGLGESFLPLRFLNPPEINILELY